MQVQKNVAINAVIEWGEEIKFNRKTGYAKMNVQDNQGDWHNDVEFFIGDWINAQGGRVTVETAFVKECMSRAVEALFVAGGVTMNILPADIPSDDVVFPASEPE